MKSLPLMASVCLFLLGAAPPPDIVKKMVSQSWDFDVADCKIYVLPKGKKLRANIRCTSNSQHPLMALGYALGERGIEWCGVSGFTKQVEVSVYNGSFEVVLEDC